MSRDGDPARNLLLAGLLAGGAWVLWRSTAAGPDTAGGEYEQVPQDPQALLLLPPIDLAPPSDLAPAGGIIGAIVLAVQNLVAPASATAPAPTRRALTAIDTAAQLAGVDPSLFRAVLFTESGFNPSAYNANGNGTYDYGIAQLNSATFPGAAELSVSSQLNQAAQYLAGLIAARGSVAAGVAAYNGSGAAAQAYAQRVLATAAQIAAGRFTLSSAAVNNLAATSAMV